MVSLSKGAMNVAGAKMYFENHYSGARLLRAGRDARERLRAWAKEREARAQQGNEITAEQFDRLLHGRDPNSGASLRPRATPRRRTSGLAGT